MSILIDIEKRWGSFCLKVKCEAENETLALLGESGYGKSMTLRCIAGIERPDRGRIVLDGATLFDSEKKINLSPQERRVGLLFQNYALFPNMTVRQNIRMGAKREMCEKRREQKISLMMERFGITELADRYPHQLSGGQQQRTALARILVSDPRILLLDEPFSALDHHLRFRLEQEVREVIRNFGGTVLLVSHDRDEVYRMADRIAVMKDGRIETIGEKKEVFQNPGTKTGAQLTGCKNISRIEQLGEFRVRAIDWNLDVTLNQPVGDAGYIGIRMHDVEAVQENYVQKSGAQENSVQDTLENVFTCTVEEVVENPFSYVIMLRPVDGDTGIPIGWETDKETWKRVQAQEIQISLPAKAMLLLEEE